MTAKKSAPPESENATFVHDRCKGKQKIRKVIIPAAAFDIIAFSKEENLFVKALYDIATCVDGEYKMDQFLQVAISTIRRETNDYYASKSKGGMASVDARAKTMEPVHIPELVPPPSMKSFDIGDKYRTWHISTKQLLEIRYVMFSRNFAPSEVERCLNEFLIKRPNQGVPVSGMDELWEKIQKWDNFDRGQRFYTCPEFHQLCLTLMENASPSLRAEFLDKRFAAELTGDNCLRIKCSQAVKDLLVKNKELFRQSIMTKHPNCHVAFEIISGYY